MRKVPLVNNQYYHIYNRGVDKRDVFMNEKDYSRFLTGMREFNCLEPIGSLYEKHLREKKSRGSLASIMEAKLPRIVEIACYCLNPNHYHFILKQIDDKGIEKFMQRIGTAYTKYFNEKYKRSGALFQGTFKSTHIDSNGLLFYLSAYVNCNSEVHEIAKAEDYKWSSFPDYIGKRNGTLCEKEIILGQYRSGDEYKKDAIETAMNITKRRNFEKVLIE